MLVTCKGVGTYKKAILLNIGRKSEHSRGVKALVIKSESGTKSKESQIYKQKQTDYIIYTIL
jgi:hypothetical protein